MSDRSIKYLVTGGAGFIGSALCREIVSNSVGRVVNVDKLTYAANLNSLDSIAASDRYSFHQLDICDRERIGAVFEAERPDVVMHLAAETHVDRSITGPADFIMSNLVGTYTMLEAARSYWEQLDGEHRDRFRFLHISTDEVFGSLGPSGAFVEDTSYDPSSPYSASKAGADHLAMAWHRTYGVPVLMSNCSNNYGPYHFPEKLVPLIITNALNGVSLPVYGKGENIRDWLYVEDHARALLAIASRGTPGRSYNVGTRDERTNLQVVQAICQHLDELKPRGNGACYADLIAYVPDRPGHDFRYAIDPARIETELGWRAEETFTTGLEKTVRWYLRNEDWWRPLREGVYDGARLGLLDKRA